MKRYVIWLLCAAVLFMLGGCATSDQDDASVPQPDVPTATPEDGLAVDVGEHDDLTVTNGGVYTFSGTKTDIGILVNAPKQDVTLVLNGVTLENHNGPAIFVKEAGSVTITLADGTTNTLSDGSSYTFTDSETNVDAAVFSRADLIVNGNGTLIVNGNYQHGIVSKDTLSIVSGAMNITSQGDGIQANDTITVSGGQVTVTAGDDGVHADTDLVVSGENTTLTVTQSYEALEATSVIISGGTLSLNATDDGINAAGGNDGSAMDGRPGQGMFSASTGSVAISGGDVYIRAAGDAIDSNGTLQISGGDIVVSGATRGDTAMLDFDTTGEISGGTFVGTGAAGMAQNFSSTSSQGVMMVSASGQAGTVITLTDADGNQLLTRTADQAFSCIILSHPDLVKGKTYTVTVGTSSTDVEMTATVVGEGNHGMGGMGGGGHRPPNSNRPDGYFPNGTPQNGIQPRSE